MPIRSPYNSFVDFNTEVTDCDGNSRQAALPVVSNFAIKFQIKVEDELLPSDTELFAAVCSEDCETLLNPNKAVVPICPRFKFMDGDGQPLTDDYFPILVGNYTPSGGQPKVPEGSYDKETFLQVVSDTYETSLAGLDFIDCCEIPTISGIVVFYNGVGIAKVIALNRYYGYGYVDFPAANMNGVVGIGECFRYCILDADDNVLRCSSLFYRETDTCYTTTLTYSNEENGYDFKYVSYDDAGTTKITENQIRVPIYLRKPAFTVTENIFRRSDGVKERTSTIIEKDWLGTVGYLSADQHGKLVCALKHDNLIVDNAFSGVNYRMTQEGEYTIGYAEELNYPLAPAEFRISDYSHNYVNNNCGFECGVELIQDCEGDGGVVTPCPDKYMVEFTVGGSEMADGATSYQDDNLIGVGQVEVYREGLIQYTFGVNSYSFNSITGIITFTPAVYVDERIAIWEV